MERLVNSSVMKRCDYNTIHYYGVPSMVLMERAALSVVEEIENLKQNTACCLVVCGLGNNGGDGLAIARLLYQKGCQVDVVMEWKEEKASDETKMQYEIAVRYGISILKEIPKKPYTLVIDALLGIGLTRNLEGNYQKLVAQMNNLTADKLAVDIPSGINADTGQVMGTAFLADTTVTFAYNKIGMVLYPGLYYAGKVIRKDIGIDNRSWLNETPSLLSYQFSDLELLPARIPHSNKGSYGKVLVIAGQKNMAGAAFLSGKAALVTGCGLVKIFTSEENRMIIQSLLPEAILETWTEEEATNGELAIKLSEALKWADVVVAGPGLGMKKAAKQQIMCVLSMASVPMVLDADALNLIAEADTGLLKQKKAEVIVTPHLGEMSRLCKITIAEIQKSPLTTAADFSKDYGVICVQKDARTVCALPNGKMYVNQSGNNGMATAGSGDVLTGIIAGLLAQKSEPETMVPLGVYLHGLAGDRIAEKTGTYGMMASDIIEGLKQVMGKEYTYE